MDRAHTSRGTLSRQAAALLLAGDAVVPTFRLFRRRGAAHPRAGDARGRAADLCARPAHGRRALGFMGSAALDGVADLSRCRALVDAGWLADLVGHAGAFGDLSGGATF